MFLDVLFLYLVFSSILIFSEINARMYLSQKISIFNILECFCFPVVYVLVFLSVIIKVYRFRYICILWRLKNDSPEKEDDKKKS